MNLILKQFLIIGSTFLIILWFQYQDDKKHKKKRKSFYDKYKFPLLVSSIIGLMLNLPILFDMNVKQSFSKDSNFEVTIVTPVEKCDIAKTFIHNNNFGSHNKEQLSWFDNGKPVSDQEIFTDLPDF